MVIVPCLETNCEATPTSNEANTGEWSLVMMSLVHPASWKIWLNESRKISLKGHSSYFALYFH